MALVGAVVACYGRTLAFGFTRWDDLATVAENPRLVSGLDGIVAIWTQDQGSLYIPLTYTLWWAVAQVFGVVPWAFHGLKVVLHAGAAVGVYVLLRRLLKSETGGPAWGPLLGAGLFALHPLQAESVAWVSGTKDLLAGLLGVWAVWAFVMWRGEGKRGWYAAFVVLSALALLSKPSAVVVPAVAVVLDGVWLRTPWRRSLWAVTPVVGLAVLATGVTKYVQPPVAGLDDVGLGQRLWVAADAVGWYAAALVHELIPGWTQLSVDPGRSPGALFAGQVPAARGLWVVGVMVLTLGVAGVARSWRVVGVAGGVFVVALLPNLGLVPFEYQRYSTVAAHYAYVAMLGPAIAVAWGVSRVGVRGAALVGIGVAWAGVMAWGATGPFRDTRSLFEQVERINPRSWAAPGVLAVEAMGAGEMDKAIELSRRSLERNPRQIAARVTLGAALERTGDDPGAEAAFRSAAEIDPGHPSVLTALGTLLARTGRGDEGERLLRQALSADPYSAPAHASLGVLLAQRGQLTEALNHLRRARRLAPGDEGVRRNLEVLEAAGVGR